MSKKKLVYHSYRCKNCKRGWLVVKGSEKEELLRKELPCATTHCGQTLIRGTATVVGKTDRVLSALNLHTASRGFGLPEERQCDVDSVKKVLLKKKIMKVFLGPAYGSPNRSVIGFIELEGGVQVHLGASQMSGGALVFKVTNVEQ